MHCRFSSLTGFQSELNYGLGLVFFFTSDDKEKKKRKERN